MPNLTKRGPLAVASGRSRCGGVVVTGECEHRLDQQYLPDHDPDFDVVYALRPRSAMVWRLDDYAASQRRWLADLW
jgi:hypothetical protein